MESPTSLRTIAQRDLQGAEHRVLDLSNWAPQPVVIAMLEHIYGREPSLLSTEKMSDYLVEPSSLSELIDLWGIGERFDLDKLTVQVEHVFAATLDEAVNALHANLVGAFFEEVVELIYADDAIYSWYRRALKELLINNVTENMGYHICHWYGSAFIETHAKFAHDVTREQARRLGALKRTI